MYKYITYISNISQIFDVLLINLSETAQLIYFKPTIDVIL